MTISFLFVFLIVSSSFFGTISTAFTNPRYVPTKTLPREQITFAHFQERSKRSTTTTATTTTTTTTTTTRLEAAPFFQPFSSLLASRGKMRELFSSSSTTNSSSSSSSSDRDVKKKLALFKKRQRIREELEDWQEEDFFSVSIKPKQLVHERDFFRQSTLVQSWDEYVLVSILCTSISYNGLSTFQLNPDHEGIFLYEFVLKTCIQLVAGTGVLSGLYATMVFSLSILYGRTALGLERDPEYDVYLEDTEDIRCNGFRAFSISLFSFALLVVLVVAEDIPLVMHLPAGGAMIAALYIGVRDWKLLVNKASDIYDFMDDDDEEHDNQNDN